MAKWAAIMAVLLLAAAWAAAPAAAQCNAGQLAICAGAIIGGSAPSASCCSNLRAQRGCFCQYARNPAYASYINSANARKTLTSCGIAIPRC
ncbi:non-specific lipid-transfer protein 2P-like [Oryza glaberrima]|uniref:Bifunctional inhibitor/plant lipid transfer protein/seed storage helical domain-containing protein n=2 Tax=Oryza TaxID=4527 RepID=A0A0D3HFF0_9ORYZ|nr:non-specific lipid-transfer protein 2P-like [Oryza glaberrima]